MPELNKMGGVALILGALLNITRIIPIIATQGVSSENFPPHSVIDTVFVAQTYGWHISHIMGLVSLPLLLFGFAAFISELRKRRAASGSLAALVGAGFALILYLGGLVIDGLVLPTVIRHELQDFEAGDPLAAHAIDLVHIMATSFGGFGAAVLLITSTFLGLAVWQGFGTRALGVFGAAIGIVSLIGYAIGVLSLNIVETLKLVGPLSILNSIFLTFTGFALMRTRSTSKGFNA